VAGGQTGGNELREGINNREKAGCLLRYVLTSTNRNEKEFTDLASTMKKLEAFGISTYRNKMGFTFLANTFYRLAQLTIISFPVLPFTFGINTT